MTEPVLRFICTRCGPQAEPCEHWKQKLNPSLTDRLDFIEAALCKIIHTLETLGGAILASGVNPMFGHKKELEELKRIERTDERIEKDLDKIVGFLKPRLSFIKIAFGGVMPVGPATIPVGGQLVASVLGFDQNGAPIAIDFTANPVTFTDDNQAVASDTPGSTVSDPITGVSAGVANIGATCAGFSDSEAVTVVAVAPVLSSIKVSLDAPAGVSPAVKKA